MAKTRGPRTGTPKLPKLSATKPVQMKPMSIPKVKGTAGKLARGVVSPLMSTPKIPKGLPPIAGRKPSGKASPNPSNKGLGGIAGRNSGY